jgi:hypothetical protein
VASERTRRRLERFGVEALEGRNLQSGLIAWHAVAEVPMDQRSVEVAEVPMDQRGIPVLIVPARRP